MKTIILRSLNGINLSTRDQARQAVKELKSRGLIATLADTPERSQRWGVYIKSNHAVTLTVGRLPKGNAVMPREQENALQTRSRTWLGEAVEKVIPVFYKPSFARRSNLNIM